MVDRDMIHTKYPTRGEYRTRTCVIAAQSEANHSMRIHREDREVESLGCIP